MASKMFIKINFNDEIRRINTNEDARECTFEKFSSTVKALFPQLAGKPFELTYVDDEGDTIFVSSEAEFKEALRYMTSLGRMLRFKVALMERKPSSPVDPSLKAAAEAVHRHVTCDECGVFPIRGLRYKCTVRHDFDLCSGCEAKKAQPYPMLKIYDPAVPPSAAFQRDQHHHHGFRGNCEGRWPRGGCRRWSQQAQEAIKEVQKMDGLGGLLREVMGVVDQVFKPDIEQKPSTTTEEPATTKPTEEVDEAEQQLLEAALFESLQTAVAASPVDQQQEVKVPAVTQSTASAAAVADDDEEDAVFVSGSAPVSLASSPTLTTTTVPAVAIAAPTEPVVPATSPAAIPLEAQLLLWRRELELLADMGFVDAETALPLLVRHLITPMAVSGEPAPAVEGMMRVVTGLLHP